MEWPTCSAAGVKQCVMCLDFSSCYLSRPLIWTAVILSGEVYAALADINNNGVVVGYYQDAAGVVASFMATP